MNTAILFEYNFLYAIIIGVAIGSVAGYIGSLMVTKRMTLMAGALGHLALPGVALALRYRFDVSFGALLFLFVGIAIIWLLEQRTTLPPEALTAIVFTTSVATAFLFLPEGKQEIALLGDISQLNLFICLVTVLISLLIFVITRHIFDKLILISISKDLAQTNNVSAAWYNFVYLLCIALMIALGVRIVGGLMTAALVAIPASTSRNITQTLFWYTYVSLLCGGLSCMVGIFLSQLMAIAVGPAIILSSAGLFCISLLVKK